MESEHSSSIPFHGQDIQMLPKTLNDFMKEDSEPFNHPNSEEIYYLDSKENISQFLRDHSENRMQRSILSQYSRENAEDAMITYQSKSNQQQKKLRDLVDPSYLVKQEVSESEKSEEQSVEQMLLKFEQDDEVEKETYFEQRQQIEKFQSTYQFLQGSYQLLQRYIFQKSQLPLFSVPLDFNYQSQTLQNEGSICKQSQFQRKKKHFCNAGYQKEFFIRFGVDLIQSLQKSERPHQKSLQLLISVRNNLAMIENQINYLNKELKRKYQVPFSACRICNQQFTNGRQLGGHMSRKHPGRSRDYRIKKQVREAKQCDRKRKNFLKSNYLHIKKGDCKRNNFDDENF